jgi:chemotaxis protein MotA
VIEATARLFDPLAFGLVVGGTCLAAIVTATREDLGRAVRALVPLLRARPALEERLARQAVSQIEQVVDLKGIGCADHVHTRSYFVRTAALHLVDTPTAAEFAAWAEQDLAEREGRHDSAARVWRMAADAAPAMGMIGTVLGLIGMFARMDDAAMMGSAMAVAMLTTLYGLFLSAVVAGPISARLERLSSAERRWQRAAAERLLALAIEGAPERRQWLKQHLRSEG